MYWDGRLPSSDLPTLVRDHISEAHFLQADGRLVIERMRQVPEYERQFKSAYDGEPTYGRILNAVAAFVSSLTSQDIPFDKFLTGDEAAISDAARRGLEIFKGKAGCIQCHDGAMLSDSKFHSLGLNANPDIFQDPLRHVTFRRFFRTLGVPDYASMRQDAGLYCVTKVKHDRELMRTPTLREVSRTAPYMHDGQLPTLESVVSFYNSGGGPRASKDARLKPLSLTEDEQTELVEFLKTLSGKPIEVVTPNLPAYQLRKLGDN
jgi:cytochrome c peroxidase